MRESVEKALKLLAFISGAVLAGLLIFFSVSSAGEVTTTPLKGIGLLNATVKVSCGSVDECKITVIVDNEAEPGLREAWGLSMLLTTPEKRILFDTGPSPDVLEYNARALGVDLSKIDVVVLSHEHGDHTGGLRAVLRANDAVAVYGAPGTPAQFPVFYPTPIARGVVILKPLEGPPWETALAVNVSGYGVVLLVGCCHPGVVRMVREAEETMNAPVRLVIGGMHTAGLSLQECMEIVRELKRLGVEKIAPLHCSGDVMKEAVMKVDPGMLLDARAGDEVVVSSSGAKVVKLVGQ